MKNPDYYRTVMPYLILKDVTAFLKFTKEVFDAAEKQKHTDDGGRIRHVEIMIGDSTIMAGESNENWEPQPAGLYVNVDSADETFQKALDAGATVVMELSNQDYGRTGGVRDLNGNTWWVTSVEG
ncbi:VOC family protein [Pleomorphovibrio marinus]|uniref:VOC family protein n=1 Tax=Pleomorphovibrio marinus TaxID=2164132 RepID=UPI000E0C54D7|nr:VOC family protein [Pleomorphovibrio marinus]